MSEFAAVVAAAVVVDALFNTLTSSKSSLFDAVARREAFKTYVAVGRKGVLTFPAFHSAVRSMARHLYRPAHNFYELFFEKHLLRVAHSEGDRLLAQSKSACARCTPCASVCGRGCVLCGSNSGEAGRFHAITSEGVLTGTTHLHVEQAKKSASLATRER